MLQNYMTIERITLTTFPSSLCDRPAAVKRSCYGPTVTFANLASVLIAVLDLGWECLAAKRVYSHYTSTCNV